MSLAIENMLNGWWCVRGIVYAGDVWLQCYMTDAKHPSRSSVYRKILN